MSIENVVSSQIPLVRVHGAADVRIDEVAMPQTGPRDVLIRVGAVGICGTDLGFIAAGGRGKGEPVLEPLALGHEFSGVVEKIGDEVEGVLPGQRFAVNPDGSRLGVGGAGGAFSTHVLIPNAQVGTDLFTIPDSLSLEHAALAEPLSVALHGINMGAVGAGDKVVVLGAGPIGLCTVICLRNRGVTDIVVSDLSDARLARAAALGATTLVNPARQPFAKVLGQTHGEGTRLGKAYVGTDVFIDTAGALKALEDVIEVVKFRGRIVVVALHKKPLQLDLWKVMANEFSIVGSIAINRADEFGECVRMLAEGRVDVAPLISHRMPFAQVEDAFKLATDPDAAAKVIVSLPEAT